MRAQAVMALDYSGSMRGHYRSGNVQMLVDRALGFALQIDADGEIPIIKFDDRIYPTVPVNVGNYRGIVDRELAVGHMGGTTMAPVFDRVRDMSADTDAPIFLIVVGDGSPSDRRATKKAVYELAGYPVFIKFLTLLPVDFLQELDDATDRDRLLDNVDAQSVPDPAGISDLDFAKLMVEEWDSWIKLATDKGVLV
jgi:hypothetical protein